MTKGEQLLRDGFCTFPNVMPADMIDELTIATDALYAAYPQAEKDRHKYQGSAIFLAYQYPVLAKLIAWPGNLDAMRELGYPDPKYQSGYIISKPPHAPPLYWHQDWPLWDEPCSANVSPPQLFLMYYLTDTTRENGCLRVIPRTHRTRIPFHSTLGDAHTDQTYQANPDSPLFATHPEEIDVCVKTGDLVVGDARVLHAAHANQSDKRRTVITLWYHPNFEELDESVKAVVATRNVIPVPPTIEEPWRSRLEKLKPIYSGTAKPAKWNRVPGKLLKAS